MPAPFGAYQPGSPGRAPLLPPQFLGEYSIYANGQNYNPGEYFSPGVTSYTIVLKFEGTNWSDNPFAGGYATIRENIAPGTPLSQVTQKLERGIGALIYMRESGRGLQPFR